MGSSHARSPTFSHLSHARPAYFRSEEKWRARLLLLGVIAAEFGVVYALVAFNHWNGFFFNAIQNRDWYGFIYSLPLFGIIAVWTALATMAQFFRPTLIMYWRRWMTGNTSTAGWPTDAITACASA
jgi:ABC-type uncharacterized transport system fused permease/ATPase subunit